MPITYAIDDTQGIVRVKWTGNVSGAECATHIAKMLADPSARRYARNLSDVREATGFPAGTELSLDLHQVIVPRLPPARWTTAILVDSPQQYGVARQFEAYGSDFLRCEIFRDEAEAIAWLRAPE